MGLSVSHALTSEFCDGCALGKAHPKPFKSYPCRAMSTDEIINADVNGPMSVASFSGAQYVCFKDDYYKCQKIFFLEKKSDVSCCLHMFLKLTITKLTIMVML